MGIHKYRTANRLLGYQAHLERLQHFATKWRQHVDTVGWEEIMRAWRIVQPTLLAQIYAPSTTWPWRWLPRQLRSRLGPIVVQPAVQPPNERKEADASVFSDGENWFDPRITINKVSSAKYDSGGYLQTHKYVFLFIVISCFALATVGLVHGWLKGTGGWAATTAALAFLVLSASAATARWTNMWGKIDILENGAGSIHSCAIIWEATTLAHLQALKQLGFFGPGKDDVKTLHGYTRLLAYEAASIADQARNIHKWIYLARLSLYEVGNQGTEHSGSIYPKKYSYHIEPWQHEIFRRAGRASPSGGVKIHRPKRLDADR